MTMEQNAQPIRVAQQSGGHQRHMAVQAGRLLHCIADFFNGIGRLVGTVIDGILGPIGGKKVGIHPARVRKLMVSTNVCGRKLAAT